MSNQGGIAALASANQISNQPITGWTNMAGEIMLIAYRWFENTRH
jgi:hypothetical protein